MPKIEESPVAATATPLMAAAMANAVIWNSTFAVAESNFAFFRAAPVLQTRDHSSSSSCLDSAAQPVQWHRSPRRHGFDTPNTSGVYEQAVAVTREIIWTRC